MTPGPDLADSVGNWIVFAIGVGLTIWRRGKQNQALGDRIDTSLAAQVSMIKNQVTKIESSLTITQNLVAIHAERLKEGNLVATDLTYKIGQLEEAVKKGDDLVLKFNDYLERVQAGSLYKPIKKKEET